MLFPVIIHKDSDSDYGITVPDLPGCFSAGSTIQEALTNAREAIECHIEGLMIDGESLPPAAKLEDALADIEEPFQLAVVEINLDELSNERERVNISVPKIVLRAIDKAATRAGKTRSAYIVDATLSESRKINPDDSAAA